MRLWSIHPKYLDAKGIVAVWREALLAKQVLKGNTKGYTRHPQLRIFKIQKDPTSSINVYLHHIWIEAERRGYSFDRTKIGKNLTKRRMAIGKKELELEFDHLKNKLKKRDLKRYAALLKAKSIKPHPMFIVSK